MNPFRSLLFFLWKNPISIPVYLILFLGIGFGITVTILNIPPKPGNGWVIYLMTAVVVIFSGALLVVTAIDRKNPAYLWARTVLPLGAYPECKERAEKLLPLLDVRLQAESEEFLYYCLWEEYAGAVLKTLNELHARNFAEFKPNTFSHAQDWLEEHQRKSLDLRAASRVTMKIANAGKKRTRKIYSRVKKLHSEITTLAGQEPPNYSEELGRIKPQVWPGLSYNIIDEVNGTLAVILRVPKSEVPACEMKFS